MKTYDTYTYRTFSTLLVFLFFSNIMFGCRDDHIFRDGITSPSPVGDSFVVVGDSRSGDSIYRDIVSAITSSLSYANAMFHVGDMIETPGNQGQWNNFMNMTAPIARIMPWYAVVGNHDVGSIPSQNMYQSVMDDPSKKLYYSFNLNESHFIILDTEIPGQEGGIVGEQLAWLTQDLQMSASAPYTFVFTHRPVFPQGHYKGHDLANAQELHQLFMQYGVDAVFSGHEHQYYMYLKDGMPYIVTGGGGSPLYDDGIGEKYHHFLLVEQLPPNTFHVQILDVHGKIIKTETLTSR